MMNTPEVELEFVIQNYPAASQLNYFLAVLEGELVIKIDQQLFFREPNMLLAEFGAVLKKWLAKRNETVGLLPLVYFTMDHDESEGPIISLQPLNEKQYYISSIWQEFECLVAIPEHVMVDATQSFIHRLETALLSKGITSLSNPL